MTSTGHQPLENPARGVRFWVQGCPSNSEGGCKRSLKLAHRRQQPAGFLLDNPGLEKAWILEGIGSLGWTRSRWRRVKRVAARPRRTGWGDNRPKGGWLPECNSIQRGRP